MRNTLTENFLFIIMLCAVMIAISNGVIMLTLFDLTTPSQVECRYFREYEVTAYCPCEICCGRYADGITASGYVIQPGGMLIAADLPWGTMITVPGYGRAPVLDRGGAIGKGRLDVLYHSHQAALEWGRQTLLCEVER